MLKKLNGIFYVYIFIIIFVLVIFYQTLHLHYFTSKIVPFILCIAVFALTMAGIISELLQMRKNKATTLVLHAKDRDKETEEDKPQKGMLTSTLWVFVLALLIYLFGFLIAMPVFILAYMKCHGGGSWLESIITAITASGVIYVVFVLLLEADLYEGKLFILFS